YSAYLAEMLELRLRKILVRYFQKLSPLADLQLTATNQLCALDLARRRQVWPETTFHCAAVVKSHLGTRATTVQRGNDGAICLHLPQIQAAANVPPNAAEHYVIATIHNEVARHPLHAHFYDLGDRDGYRLVGIERPDSD